MVSGFRVRKWPLLTAVMVVLIAAGGVANAFGVVEYVGYVFTHRIGAPESTWVPSAPKAGDPPAIRLAVAGDVGTGSATAYRTAEVISERSEHGAFDALILLGDNVYPSGDPAKLPEKVFQPFASVLSAGTPLLAVLGNHDVRDNNRDGHVSGIGMPGPWYESRIANVHFFGLDSTQRADPGQLDWFESAVSASDATWKIVALHHSPYSAGRGGSDEVIRRLYVPLFEEYGVQLVLAGHAHDYQRSREMDGVTYVVSGAGAKKVGAARADFTEVAWSTYHFVELNAWEDRMELQAIDHDGRAFDEVTIDP